MSKLELAIKKPLAFIYRDFLISISYRFEFISELLKIVFSLFTLFFLSKIFDTKSISSIGKYGGDYFSFVIIGYAFSNYLNVALNGLSAKIQREQMVGTLESLLITQTSIPTIILSSTLYRFIFNSITVILYLTIANIAVDIDFSRANYGVAFLVFILTILSFSSLGIISASFVIIMKRGNPINWIFTSLSWLLGGVYYPVSVLPGWMQKISFSLPLTHALEGMRLALLQGYSMAELRQTILFLGIFDLIMLPVSLTIFRWALNIAKKHGSLTQY